ncbi:hypothetical protein [Streptomyces sp. F-1]|uniref:hypothetical protein n=1 Tax=Streptomyces sp. F-1 TaxID=463642 RepID=UPI00085C7956|nr:hypothetical protein [Streptomyces sp. F-1]SFY48666.1 hypothetical protein STEPF1_01892 [Streptomyces sp. F-1]
MGSDLRRELIPRNSTLHLIDSLDAMQSRLRSAAEQTHLLDDAGRVPATPSYAELLQHAAEAQALSRDVLQLTADVARSSHSTTRVGNSVLAHLATATTMSSHAVPHLAEAAEHALALLRSASPADRDYLTNHMVSDHAAGRAYLRRTSQALRNTVKELNDHLDAHRSFLATPQRQSPTPPPPGPNGRHR